ADLHPPMKRAAMDDESTERPLRVGHGEQVAATARFAQHTLVADLPAAFGVERRAVEDDLGLAVSGQLIELHPVADDRNDPALRGRGLVSKEGRVAGAGLDRAVERSRAGLLRELRFRPATAPLALFGKGDLEPV